MHFIPGLDVLRVQEQELRKLCPQLLGEFGGTEQGETPGEWHLELFEQELLRMDDGG